MILNVFNRPEVWQSDQELPVVGQASKAEVHARGLWHWSVHLLIYLVDGRVVLRRRGDDELRYAGLWTSTLGTHVPHDQDYARTVASFTGQDMDLIWAGEFMVEDSYEREVCGLFTATIPSMLHLPKALLHGRTALCAIQLAHVTAQGAMTPHLGSALLRV